MRRKCGKSAENGRNFFSKKLLDRLNAPAYSPPPVAVLKGAATGEGIGKRRGNAMLEDSNQRLSCCH
jgi:hypothetical protein